MSDWTQERIALLRGASLHYLDRTAVDEELMSALDEIERLRELRLPDPPPHKAFVAQLLEEIEQLRACHEIDGQAMAELHTENHQLRERIAELESLLRWIPVEERLPEPREMVEACRMRPTRIRWLGWRYEDGPLRSSDGVLTASHWRPLPPLPTEGSDEG